MASAEDQSSMTGREATATVFPGNPLTTEEVPLEHPLPVENAQEKNVTSDRPMELADMSNRTMASTSSEFVTSPSQPLDGAQDIKEDQNPIAEPSSLAASQNPPLPLPTSLANDQEDSIASPPTLTREQTSPAIGPATDKPISSLRQSETPGPQLVIALLLNTGQRHPYIIDQKYLKKRNITVADNNPVNMSVYTLKELIWRDWRDDWDPRPSSPSSIRLIQLGKMLDDKSHLKDSKFIVGDTPHVVHMTVKPQEVVDDEDARIAKGGGRDRDSTDRTPGCRCTIM